MSLVIQNEGQKKETFHRFLVSEQKISDIDQLQIVPFTSGRSNLTYLLKTEEWEGVLRRPPAGPLPPKAHDMLREFEVPRKLNAILPVVPKPFVFCDDLNVLGVPFYIMEKKEGKTLDDNPAQNNITIEEMRLISQQMVDTLANIHSIDFKQADLSDLGYPARFTKRQMKNWRKRYEHFKTDDLPIVNGIYEWLEKNLPNEQSPALIHNDFKINNVLFSQDFKEVTAVLDWEMATIGEPLFDLGAALSYWLQYDDSPLITNSLTMPTTVKGFYTRDEFLHRYSLQSGRDVSQINFYLVLAYFKTAIAVQQIYYRYKKGQTQDGRFSHYNRNVNNILQYALSIIY